MKRRQRAVRHNLWFYFTMAIFGEFCLSILLGVGLILILNLLFGISMSVPNAIWVLVASSAVAGIIALLLNQRIFRPMRALSSAINRVAGGDFKVRLECASRSAAIRQIYQDFNVMVAELEKTEVLQSDFVSNVSHEFKTPINAIEGYATLLQDGSGSPQQRGYVERILLNTRRLSTLVGNILLLSKVSNHAIPTAQATYRVDEQIRQAILLLEPKWEEREVEFDVDLDEVTWNGPESLMHHVWSNLIGNAIKFGPRGGLVSIRLKGGAEDFVFSVADQGAGVPETERKRIFHKFYQLDSSHKQEGNGLGLALVKQIVDGCGGEITVENLPEGGCRFDVRLPMN